MVKDGYKQTDIGIIPNDWDIKAYDEIFNFLTTATYSRSQLSNNGEIQYLHYGDIHTKYNFALDFDKVELPKIKNEQLKKYPLLKDGDILIADASEDYDGICKSIEVKNIKEKKAISGLHTFLLRDKNENLAYGFKGYLSSNHLIKKQFDKLATGMKVYGVSKGNLKTVQIPIPPKEEQKAIAIALSDTDELIEQLQKLISKKENIKTATMQLLLTGKKRLNGFSDEWVEKKLGDLCEMSSGGTPSTKISKYYGGNIPWLSISDITIAGKYILKTEKNLSALGIANSAAKIFDKGILLLAMYASIGKCCIAKVDISTSQAILGIKTNNQIYTEFLYYYFLLFRNKLASSGQQGTQSNLNKGMVEDIKLDLPKIEEQTAIANILSDMDKEIETLKSKLSKTKAIKEGMMSELLSGNTRLM